MTAKHIAIGSGAEEKFIELFCEVFGPDKGQQVYLQYPFTDIYGKQRTIDFAMNTPEGKIAIEIDGETWHNPQKVSEDKYTDDLLKQNSLTFNGWRIYRWTDSQLNKSIERVKDELVTFLGRNPSLLELNEFLPHQSGEIITLREHQSDALKNLSAMRRAGKTIALVERATGTGKSAIGVLDAKAVGGRVLFLAHTKELVAQGLANFKKLYPEASSEIFNANSKEKITSKVVCATIQSIVRNLDMFKADEFSYLVIDECHHAAAATYKNILSYFKPLFTLGLTATPEREDGKDLLEIFQNTTPRLDVSTAVEQGLLAPVRCIRIKTNIDLSSVRINGFRYNSLDLENKIKIPARNELIVDTYKKFAINKPTVVFCTSVNHASELEKLFTNQNIAAKCISGRTPASKRPKILDDYKNRKVAVLLACDLLNEGWDSPETEVLFMARPTMSKTIYLQQLGRGMRTAAGKEFLLVFDFVDNAGLFNTPYSMHRMFNISEYYPGGLVLGKKNDIRWDKTMFKHGEKPTAIIDYPVYALDYENVDIFNWQNEAKNMLSVLELTRRINVQYETVNNYIAEGKIKADLEIPIGNNKTFKYFKRDRIGEFCARFGWQEITIANIKDIFMKMLDYKAMTKSYKPVFIKAFFDFIDEKGSARIEDVVQAFRDFYDERRKTGLLIEKGKSILNNLDCQDKDIERLILSQPFKRFEGCGFMHHSRCLGTIELDQRVFRQLTIDDKVKIINKADEALKRYYKE